MGHLFQVNSPLLMSVFSTLWEWSHARAPTRNFNSLIRHFTLFSAMREGFFSHSPEDKAEITWLILNLMQTVTGIRLLTMQNVRKLLSCLWRYDVIKFVFSSGNESLRPPPPARPPISDSVTWKSLFMIIPFGPQILLKSKFSSEQKGTGREESREMWKGNIISYVFFCPRIRYWCFLPPRLYNAISYAWLFQSRDGATRQSKLIAAVATLIWSAHWQQVNR